MKPVPKPSNTTSPFWDGTKNGELWIQQCEDCGSIFFPAVVCRNCLSSKIKWIRASGRGEIYTYSIVYRPPNAFMEDAPIILAIVELEEGVHMMCNIIDCEIDDVYIGKDVEVVFEARGGYNLPQFKPAGSSSR